jgi:CBS domain containing-hemolysin-like protein
MSIWPFIAIIVLLAINGFFVALEFALVGSRSSRLEPMADDGDRSAVRALAAMRELSVQLAGAQLGITIASLLLGLIAEPAVSGLLESPIARLPKLPSGWVHPLAAVISLLIVVFAHMVLGEMVPKNITLTRPESTLRLLTGPNRAYLLLARPFVRVLNFAANAGVRLFGVEPRDELASAHTTAELAMLVNASKNEGTIPDTAAQILSGVLDFGGRTVATACTPLERVITVSASSSATEAEELVLANDRTRLVVVGRRGFEDVRGFLHAKDLLPISPDAAPSTPVSLLIRPMPAVGSSTTLESALAVMREHRVHLLRVNDDHGAMVGIITLDDLLRELLADLTPDLGEDARTNRSDSGPTP